MDMSRHNSSVSKLSTLQINRIPLSTAEPIMPTVILKLCILMESFEKNDSII